MATTSIGTAQLPLSKVDYAFKSVSEYCPLKINDIVIIMRKEDGYINLTKLCQAGGKELNHWNSRKRRDQFLEQVSSTTGIPVVELIRQDKGGNNNRHTWGHRRVAINIAQWISPQFDNAVSGWVEELLVTGCVTLGQEKTQQELEEATKKLFEQAKEIEEKDKVITKYKDESLLFQSKYARLQSNHRSMLYRREYYKFKEGHCFYLVRDPNYEESKGICKFGISKNVNQRLKQLRTTWPNLQISLIAYIENEHAVKLLEESIRKRYAGKGLLMEQNHEVLKGVDINKVIMRAKSFLKHITHEIEQNIDTYNEQNMITENEDADHDTTVAETESMITLQDIRERQDETEDDNETVVGEGENEDEPDIESEPEREPETQIQIPKKRTERIYDKVKVEGKDMFECRQCKKQFSMQSSVFRHYREKHEPIIIKCTEPDCNEEFYRKERLEEHIARVHNNRLFPCTKCDKQFRQAQMLKEHVEREHENIRHVCMYCNKAYTRQNVLKGHIASKHTKTSKHHCVDCNRYFPSKINYEKHRQKKHFILIS